MGFLDNAGLARFYNGIKSKFAGTSVATTSANGLMSSSDKTKINALKSGANVQIQYGRTSTTVAAKSSADIAIAFNPAFSGTPRMISALQTRGATSYARVCGYADSSTSGGVRVYNENSAEKTITVDWVAVR